MNAENFEVKWFGQIDAESAKAVVVPEEHAHLKNSHDEVELATVVTMLKHAKDAGDIPDRLRKIRHVSYFNSEKAVRRFTKKLVANGYIDVNVAKFIGVPFWRIDFFRIGNTTLPHMAHWRYVIKKMTEKAGGDYDGCEFQTMSADVPDESLQPEHDDPIWSLVTMVPRDQSANDGEQDAPQSLAA